MLRKPPLIEGAVWFVLGYFAVPYVGWLPWAAFVMTYISIDMLNLWAFWRAVDISHRIVEHFVETHGVPFSEEGLDAIYAEARRHTFDKYHAYSPYSGLLIYWEHRAMWKVIQRERQ